MAKGLPSTLEGGELAPGLPEASPRRSTRAPCPEERGEAEARPPGWATSEPGLEVAAEEAGEGCPTVPAPSAIGTSQVDSADVDQARLDAFVRARIGGLRACYESQLKLDQRTDGTVRMRFSIQPTGELSNVAVAQDTLRSELVAQCVVGLVRAWRTPFRPSQPVSVEYPFVFRPSVE